MDHKLYLKLLKQEFVPALGCTEPTAVALATAKAASVLNESPEKIELFVSGNIFKNAFGVGIPGTGMTGLDIATVLGAIGGNSDLGLEVLRDVNKEDIKRSQKFIKENRLEISIKENVDNLYIECFIHSKNNISHVIIEKRHSNFILVKRNEETLLDTRNTESEDNKETPITDLINFKGIYEFITTVNIKDLEFINEGIDLNTAISEEGLKGDYGIRYGKNIAESIEKKDFADNLVNNAVMYTTAASDARMSGVNMPVMANCGSGNQGLSVTLPIIAIAKKLESPNELLLRSLALALLTSTYMKSYIGQLSAFCGVAIAGCGAACGITLLMGGDANSMDLAIKNMAGGVTGMICDGAKSGCSMKVCSAVTTAVHSAFFAINNEGLDAQNGIIDEDIEQTIKNIGEIAVLGLKDADSVILKQMLSKYK